MKLLLLCSCHPIRRTSPSRLTSLAITYSIIAPLVLGFATVGLYLIYLAYSYNLLFVFNADVDTKGLVYPRALQQTTTGCYLGIICLIGLFAVKGAVGPLILMIIFLVFVMLWHFSLNSAIDPLLNYLPKSLQVEEESLLALEDGQTNQEDMRDDKEAQVVGLNQSTSESPTSTPNGNGSNNTNKVLKLVPRPTFSQKPNLLTKFLFPHKHTDYHSFRQMVPRNFVDTSYPEQVERDAYFHPAIKAELPTLWIPRDPMGVSAQECRHTRATIPITDAMAGFDEKGRMVWDRDSGEQPPVYEEKVYY